MNTERRQLVEIKFHAHAINSPKVVPPKLLTGERRAKVQDFGSYDGKCYKQRSSILYRIKGLRS